MSSYSGGSRSKTLFGVIAGGIMLILLFLLVVGFIAACTGFDRPEAGTIGVVRNNGPTDNRNIREVLEPGSGTSWIGLFSDTHFYPADTVQRYYTITADPSAAGDRPGIVDVVKIPTSDGIRLGVEGQFLFKTGFNGTPEGKALVRAFDDQFGVRTFPHPDKGELHPYDGDAGWSAYLNSIVRPIIDNELRVAMADFRCEELITSCSLVVSQGRGELEEAGAQNTANLTQMQDTVQEGVVTQLDKALGQAYFKEVSFKLVRVEPDPEIQAAINTALAAFAQISTAEAQVQQAEQQRIAAEKLAEVYEKSPALAQIQMIREAKNLPNATIYIGVSPTITTGR